MKWLLAGLGTAACWLPVTAQSVVAGVVAGMARYAHIAPGDTTVRQGPVAGLTARLAGGALVAHLSYTEGPLDSAQHLATGALSVGWTIMPPVTVFFGTHAVTDIRTDSTRHWTLWHLAGEARLPLGPLPATAHVRLGMAPFGSVTRGGAFDAGWSFAGGLSARPLGAPFVLQVEYRLERLAGAANLLTDALELVTIGASWRLR